MHSTPSSTPQHLTLLGARARLYRTSPTRRSPFRLRALALLLVALAASACSLLHRSPTARAADLARAVGELELAAIQANTTMDAKTGKPLLATATTRAIVQFAVSAETMLRTPTG